MEVRALQRIALGCAGALALAAVAFANGKASKRDEWLASLVKAERAFASAVRHTGMREAFVEYAGDSAILFRPGPVPAREWLNQQSPGGGILTWMPTYADVSNAGDLGWTTGPWEFAANKSEHPRSFGQYVSVWRRQKDGSWRYVLDIGTGNPKAVSAPDPVRYAPATAGAGTHATHASAADCEMSLLTLERALSDSARVRGAREALGNWVAADARLLRRERQPRMGRTNVVGALPGVRDTLTWEPARAIVAAHCDLACTYGTYSLRAGGASAFPPEDGHYVRLWRRAASGDWQLALDLLTPTPRN
jgi:ketosteroid isomerase-like protein